MHEEIMTYLRRKLRAAGGPADWERIAAKVGVAKSLPRKIAYGDRTNPGIETIQPLLNYFQRADEREAR